MVDIIQKFLVIYIMVFCIHMIFFFFRNKSKKYGNIPTVEMVYLMKIYEIDANAIGINYVQKHIAMINSFITTVDLLVYFYMDNMILKLAIMFVITIVLVFIFYGILGKYYRKLLFR